MLLVAALAAVLAAAPAGPAAPGDAVSLRPGPTPSPVQAVQGVPVPSPPGPPGVPGAAAGLAVAAIGIGAALGGRRRWVVEPVPVLPADVLVVFVSGHGSGYADSFDPLIANLGLPPEQVAYFDYRLVRPTTDHRRAAQDASVEEVADGLGAYLAGLAVGVWDSEDEIAGLPRGQERFEPRMSLQERERLYGGWQEAVARATLTL